MKAVALSEPDQSPPDPRRGVHLTPEQLRARKRRNLAIGISIGLLTILFYLVTIAKLGPGVFNRPL